MSKNNQEQKIKEIVDKANTEYWQNCRENDMEYSKGNKRPHQDLSLPDLISKRVNAYLAELQSELDRK